MHRMRKIGALQKRLSVRENTPKDKSEPISHHTPETRIAAVDASELVDMTVEASINGGRHEVKFLPDTGAEIDTIPLSTYATYISGTQLQRAGTCKTGTGGNIHTEGNFTAKLSWQRSDGSERSTKTEIHVLHHLTQPVLSKRTQKRLGMLHEGYPHMLLNNVHHHRAFSQHGRNCREGPTSRSPAHGRSTQHAQSDKRSTSPSKRSRVDETVLPDLNTAWVTANYQLASRMTMSFRPYGNPSPFDLDEYKDSFESWEIQWYLSYQLRHIITC